MSTRNATRIALNIARLRDAAKAVTGAESEFFAATANALEAGRPVANLDETLMAAARAITASESDEEWCNCQAICGTPGYPGPWHPKGDVTCVHAPTGNGGAK